LNRDWPFISFNLKSRGHIPYQRCVICSDVLVVRVKPQSLCLIVIGEVISNRGIAHLEELGSAHSPFVESALRAAPVVVIAFVESEETVLTPVSLKSNAAVVARDRVLYSEIVCRENAQAAPVIPDRLHRVDQDIRAGCHGRTTRIYAAGNI